jgi:hypothetical protein
VLDTWTQLAGSTDHPVDVPPIVMSLLVKDVAPAGGSVSVARNANELNAVADVPVAGVEPARVTPADVSIVTSRPDVAVDAFPASSNCSTENDHVPSASGVENVQASTALETLGISQVTSALPGLDAVTTARDPTSSPPRVIDGVESEVLRSVELAPESDALARTMLEAEVGLLVSITVETADEAADVLAPLLC